MSQPCNKNCDVPLPGEIDEDLGEFWNGNPWKIFEENNLSSFERNRTYLNVKGKGFLEVSYLSGADNDSDSRSVLALDIQKPGQLDLLVRQVGGGPLRLYENQLPLANYLKISLEGVKSNRLGIGAKLIAYVGDQKVVRDLQVSNTFRSQHPAWVHFGLGTATKVDRLVIEWPSGEDQVLQDLTANQHLVIVEGQSETKKIGPSR